MQNRHQTTSESRASLLRITPSKIPQASIDLASQILLTPAADWTRWFTKNACIDYQTSFFGQVTDLKIMVRDDPHSRRIVMTGPGNACWVATSFLSLPNGNYHVQAMYRSLDDQHKIVDFALQALIGAEVTGGRVEELTLYTCSLHTYLP